MPVQDRARVAASASVAEPAQVAGQAQVLNAALVRGQARILGDAVIAGRSRILADNDTVYVHGTANVTGDATVGDAADIFEPRHLLTVTNLGKGSDTLTLYRAKPNKEADGVWRWQARVYLAGWFGHLGDFTALVEAHAVQTWPSWEDRELDELDALLDLLHARAGQWADEEVANADRRRWQLRESDLRRAAELAERVARTGTVSQKLAKPRTTR